MVFYIFLIIQGERVNAVVRLLECSERILLCKISIFKIRGIYCVGDILSVRERRALVARRRYRKVADIGDQVNRFPEVYDKFSRILIFVYVRGNKNIKILIVGIRVPGLGFRRQNRCRRHLHKHGCNCKACKGLSGHRLSGSPCRLIVCVLFHKLRTLRLFLYAYFAESPELVNEMFALPFHVPAFFRWAPMEKLFDFSRSSTV